MPLDADTLALLAKHDRPVPRYTSYPTAPHFTHTPAELDVPARLAALPPGEAVSLYLHVPFCRVLCHYCGCHTQAVTSDSPVERFVPLLIQEIERVAARVPPALPVSQVHFGGGTPNILPLPALGRILAALWRAFTRTADTTVAMECDPRLLDTQYIQGLARLGFTRLSLGVQDFDDAVGAATNRVQPYARVRDQVATAHMEWITDINFDLMVGLPHQTPDSVAHTAGQAADLGPGRLAVFAYAHVPWMKKHQKLLERYALPGGPARFAMARTVEAVLSARGYQPIGIDHFARPGDSLHDAWATGRLRRNFQGYTDDTARILIGFGPSAISALPGAYAQNVPDTARWAQAVEGGAFATARGRVLTAEDAARARAIEQVMCAGRADDAALADPVRLAELEADGIIKTTRTGFEVTESGRPFTRLAAALFDAHYAPGVTQRHARAV